MKATIAKAAILFAILGLVLNPGAVMADTHTWVGGTLGSEDSWVEGDNWSPVGPPANLDSVIMDATDPPDSFLCELDSTFNVVLTDLTMTGDSPTKMTFNIKDKTLTVNNACVLDDYADLDIDMDFTVSTGDTNMTGTIFIDVAAGKTASLEGRVDILGTGSISVTLELDTHQTGTFTVEQLFIDADDADANRGFKLRASASTMTVTEKLQLKAGQSTGTVKANLWHAGGRLLIESGDEDNPAQLDIDGGNAPAREAQMDIDDTLAADETVATGNIRMDVASGKTAYMGEYTISGPSLIKLTGAGQALSGPRP